MNEDYDLGRDDIYLASQIIDELNIHRVKDKALIIIPN